MDDAGSVTLTVESPWMQDADGHLSTDLVVALTPQGPDYVYTLTPDPAWLANARYPVLIDPSLTATFVNPGAYAGYDYPTYTYLATPNAYVGATSANQVGAFRPFLQFDASTLPLDAEVDSALLQYSVTSALNLNTITIEAREFPFLVEPTDIVWSQDSGRNDLIIGQDLTSFAAGIPKTYTFNGGSSFPFYDYYGLDVTSIVSAWADKRYALDGDDEFQPLMLNLVLHDTADGPNGGGSGNHLGIFCSTSGSGPMVLNINYATRGWYMIQGNRRHTGRTQYPISPDATRKWWAALPTGTGAYPTFELNAAPVAVPNSASPTSGFPVIYAAVTDYADTASTRVYRIEDLGTSRNISSTVLNNFQVTGTPLVLPGSSSTVADKVILSGNGTGDDVDMAKVFRLDALTSGGTTTWTQIWMRPFENAEIDDETRQSEIMASPAFYGGYTTYTLHTTNGPTQQQTNTGGAIIVAMNMKTVLAFPSYGFKTGYMRALSLANGKNVWGHVDASGALVDALCDAGPQQGSMTPGGLCKLAEPSTHSSPAIGGMAAIVNDWSCYNNARNVTNGSWLWESAWSYSSTVESSPSLFNGRVFHGEKTSGQIVSMDWLGSSLIGGPSYDDIWTTGAFSSDHQAVIFGDDSGQVFAANTDLVSLSTYMYEKWCTTDVAPSYNIRCSPLVAGVPGSNQGNVFVGADDGFVHVLNAADGEPVTGADQFSVLIGNGLDLDDNPLPLNGAVRASMAAYQGRLYVLTTGNPVAPWPTLYCFN